MRSLTIVMAYYENPGMLARQYAALAAMAPSIREQVRLIVVDDGSPNAPAQPGECGVALEIYRMGVDVRWNQDACRNLGVDRAPDGWVLLTDIDHLIPESTLASLIVHEIDDRLAYKFERVSEPDMTPYKPHPNSWFMTKALYDKIGGYDERFAGLYGTDGDFRDRVRAKAEIDILPVALVRVPREVTPDASTTMYLRKQPEDAEGIPRVKMQRAMEPGWKTKRLTFPWSRVF